MANYCYKVMFGTLVLGLIAFLIVNVRQHVLAQGQLKLVRTLTGPVRGERRLGTVLAEARPYYAFRGIPYAERPVGAHRFKPALPVRPWKAVRSCYEHTPVCMQLNAKREVIGDEDCLYLNVYTPDVDPPAEQLRAVLVWLPGDDWFSGSGNVDQLGPEFLMEQDVLVVTVNYRLGVLGFLNLDTAEVPGNQGLGDQQLALEWIYENVRLFGGDRERITVGGAGAGAMAVQLHMYADRSAALFGRAVQMGTAFGQWHAFEKPPLNSLRAELLALVRRPLTRRVNNADLVNELQAIEARVLVETFAQRSHGWLGPSVELAQAEFPFMRGVPMDWRLERANWTTTKDVLAGCTTAEALTIGSAAGFEQFRAGAETVLPARVQSRAVGAAAGGPWSRLLRFYFPSGGSNETAAVAMASRDAYVCFVGDLQQRYLVDRRVRYVAARSTGKVYRYLFGLDTQLNLAKRWSHKEFAGPLAGAAHGDDLCYVFRCEAVAGMYTNVTAGTAPYKQIVSMSRALAQFVRTGEPGVAQWRPWSEAEPNFVNITAEAWTEASGDFAAERPLWEALVEG